MLVSSKRVVHVNKCKQGASERGAHWLTSVTSHQKESGAAGNKLDLSRGRQVEEGHAMLVVHSDHPAQEAWATERWDSVLIIRGPVTAPQAPDGQVCNM